MEEEDGRNVKVNFKSTFRTILILLSTLFGKSLWVQNNKAEFPDNHSNKVQILVFMLDPQNEI